MPVRMAVSKSLQAINAGEGVEKREPSYTVGGNVTTSERSHFTLSFPSLPFSMIELTRVFTLEKTFRRIPHKVPWNGYICMD